MNARRAIGVVLCVAALALPGCGRDYGVTVTVMLFDVSASTRSADVRDRYRATSGLVVDAVESEGGFLGVDLIDDNPIAHGSLPVNARFEPCTVLDNSLECRRERRDTRDEVDRRIEEILSRESVGTDVFGALQLARQFFAAHPEATERRIVVLSDMVQRGRGMGFPSIRRWSDESVERLLEHAPAVDLAGAEIYVVGAGATTSGSLSPDAIEGIERFWTAYLERTGAHLAFFGTTLAAYPIGAA
jgi:hypothetical protein